MFVHQSQLEHLLSPREYHELHSYQREMEKLFLPGWHFVGTIGELPRSGDFKTIDLLGQPLLVRNHEGKLHAYLNVCAHRHCRLQSVPQGHDPQFRCQYHGWEYQCDGHSAKIPDARCFRPWDRENAQLHKFRTAQWGEMTFVSLSDNGMSIEEYLGPMYDQGDHWLGRPFQFCEMWEWDYKANWKIVVENTLESYHISCLHQKTLGRPPAEEDCEHLLEDRYTTFHVPETFGWVSRIQNVFVRSLGGKVTNIYTHHLAHPHLWFISMDVMRLVQMVVPTSPNTCRHRVWLYTLEGTRRNPWAWMVRHLLRWLVKRTAKQILLEDAPIFPQVQQGLEASRARGVIGTREERIFMLQRFVRESCLTSPPRSVRGETNAPAMSSPLVTSHATDSFPRTSL
jgi:phenylpropionate dioxygenase-like ring-hydroxylating dioxygenase large terminal subunit